MSIDSARSRNAAVRGPVARGLVAGALVLALAVVATPAWAVLAEVTTSVAVGDTDDSASMERALRSAVDGVLENAISFKPTVLVVTAAMVVGDRLYVRMLLADEDGERIVGELGDSERSPDPAPSPNLAPSPTDLKI